MRVPEEVDEGAREAGVDRRKRTIGGWLASNPGTFSFGGGLRTAKNGQNGGLPLAKAGGCRVGKMPCHCMVR